MKHNICVFWTNNTKYVVFSDFLQVTQFLLDKTLVMDEDTLYDLSLKIEPRVPPG